MLTLVPKSLTDMHDWLLVVLIWLVAVHRFPNGLKLTSSGIRGLIPILAAGVSWLALKVPVQDIFHPLPRALPNMPQHSAEWPIGVALSVAVAWTLQFRAWCVQRPRSTPSPIAMGLLWGEFLSGIVIAKLLGMIIVSQHHHRGYWGSSLEDSTRGLIYAVAIMVLVGLTNNLIRGLLSQYQVLPEKPAEGSPSASHVVETMQAATKVIDTQEIERGKVIGNIERILVFIFISHNNYEALGFLMAAKGLIRSKEFEDRDRAEYILIGTLASALIAVVVSLCAQNLLSRI